MALGEGQRERSGRRRPDARETVPGLPQAGEVARAHPGVGERRHLEAGHERLAGRQLGCEVRALTWLYATGFGEHPFADAHTLPAGYDLVISAAKIQRIA